MSDDEICSKCGGHGCEEQCGLRGGCAWVYAGPDSHRVCSACNGTGKRRAAALNKEGKAWRGVGDLFSSLLE